MRLFKNPCVYPVFHQYLATEHSCTIALNLYIYYVLRLKALLRLIPSLTLHLPYLNFTHFICMTWQIIGLICLPSPYSAAQIDHSAR